MTIVRSTIFSLATLHAPITAQISVRCNSSNRLQNGWMWLTFVCVPKSAKYSAWLIDWEFKQSQDPDSNEISDQCENPLYRAGQVKHLRPKLMCRHVGRDYKFLHVCQIAQAQKESIKARDPAYFRRKKIPEEDLADSVSFSGRGHNVMNFNYDHPFHDNLSLEICVFWYENHKLATL